jgi:3-oxoacyl-[acyl-carrier protein] reductase
MESQPKMLEGKVAIITGASRGIGKEIARVYGLNGARLVLCGRSSSTQEVVYELTAEGISCVAVMGDIADGVHQKQIIKSAKDAFGRLDILVNNAGVLYQGLLGMADMNQQRAMFEVNVHAMINLSQFAIRLMALHKSGSIINMASIAGTKSIEGMPGYCASKAAVIGFTQSASKELAAKGIRVNAIAPGFIETDMTRAMPVDLFQKRVEGIRMGRIGTPLDIANSALFFASDLSSYVTGQVLGVDGSMMV